MSTVRSRFLVVDQDPLARSGLGEELRSANLDCTEAADLAFALATLETSRFDFVILDPKDIHGDLAAFAIGVGRNGATLVLAGVDPTVAHGFGVGQVLQKPWPPVQEVLDQLDVVPVDEFPAAEPLPSETPEMHLLRERGKELERRLGEQIEAFREAQETYNRDLSRMMNIVSNIMDGIVFTDVDGRIILMNPVAEELLGLRAFMTVGKNLYELPVEGELLGAIVDDARQTRDWRETSRVVEVHHTEQDLLYIKLRISHVLNYRGENAGTLVQLQDVTAEYKSDQLKNQYLSIVAHELRTPLTGIKTFSTMMSKGTLGELNDKQSRVVESIREQSLRLEHQIDKLINLRHIESNEYGQDLELLDLSDLISQSVGPFEQPAKDRSIELEVCAPGESKIVEGDRADLRRAVQALVENAVKFTTDGGRVLVEVSDTGDGAVEISVTDDGVGIDPRYHRRIFEKFFQVEDPLTRHHGGSGLGLFFVQGIVESHGSEMHVQSELGSGAKFSFLLPLKADERDEVGCVAAADSTLIEGSD